jgi:hypothetical protein
MKIYNDSGVDVIFHGEEKIRVESGALLTLMKPSEFREFLCYLIVKSIDYENFLLVDKEPSRGGEVDEISDSFAVDIDADR